jgi:hypothetical protein
MSKVVAKILDESQTVVETAIGKLEQWSGYQSADVRLLAASRAKARTKTKELGLDPDDTTPEELYHALRAKIVMDNNRLTKRLSFDKIDGSDEYLERFMEIAQHAGIHSEVWGMKWNIARRLLREHPPKRLMKHLKYRSIESMLKREYIGELFAALPLVESQRWLNVFWREVSSLNASDFENRRIQVVIMGSQEWGSFEHKHLCEALPHLGVIAIWPSKQVTKIGVVGLSMEFFAATEKLKYQSSYLKLKQFEPGFGERLLKAIKGDLESFIKFTDLSIDWHALSKHLGQLDPGNIGDWLTTHVQHEDIHHSTSLSLLTDVEPALRWWRGLEHIVVHNDGTVVSFNPSDLLSDHYRANDFENRSTESGAKAFWHKLLDSYFAHENVRNKILEHIETGKLAPETVVVDESPLEDWEKDIQQAVGA